MSKNEIQEAVDRGEEIDMEKLKRTFENADKLHKEISARIAESIRRCEEFDKKNCP